MVGPKEESVAGDELANEPFRPRTVEGLPEPGVEELRADLARLQARIGELERQALEGPLPGGKLVRHLARYRELFEQAPISIWEEDWSAVKPVVEGLRRERDVKNIGSYLREHTELVSKIAWSVQIIDFNQATVEIYRAPSKSAFWAMAIHDFLTPDEFGMFCDTVAAFAEGKVRCVVEGWEKTFDGGNIFIRDTVFIPGEFRHDWSRVVHAVEDCTEQQRAEQKIRQAQKMEVVGRLTGGLAHDLNNVLMSVEGNLELLETRLGPGREHELVTESVAAVERGADLIRKLLAFALRHPQRPKPLDLARLVSGMGPMLGRTLGGTIAVETAVGSGPHWARADPTLLESAVLNLALNARDAMPEGGRLRLELGEAEFDARMLADNPHLGGRRFVALAVSDTGIGMAPEVAERAIEPFFTTKGPGSGTGLGLSTIFGFVKQSGGHMTIESRPGAGTTVRLFLPRAEPGQPAADAVIETADEVPRGDETILLVEDDAAVRESVANLLGDLGYRVLAAADGDAALDILDGSDRRIDLLFTDIVMPGERNGRMLARDARVIRPGLKVLFTSAYPSEQFIEGSEWDADLSFVGKPYSRGYLARRLRRILDS